MDLDNHLIIKLNMLLFYIIWILFYFSLIITNIK